MMGYVVWLDVKMSDKSEAAMHEGVLAARFFIAIICGPVVNPERPEEPEEGNAYLQRPYCIKELTWAREAEVPLSLVIHASEKGNISSIVASAPEPLKFIGDIDFVDISVHDVELLNIGVRKLLRRTTFKGDEAGLEAIMAAGRKVHKNQIPAFPPSLALCH